MIYSTQQNRFWDFMSIECRNNRTDAIAMEAMSKEFSGVARTPGDAASQRHVKLCERNIARSGQHIVGVMENAASKTMFLYTVGNAMDGGAEFLCRGVHVSKARSVARCMNMLRRRRREGHPVFAGQRAGSEDGSESYAIQEPADAARVRKNFTCLATKMHGHSRYPLLELVAQGSQQEVLAQGLVDMGVEESFEAAARKVADMGPLPIGNNRDGYRPAGRAQTAKEIIRSRRKGTEAWRSCNMCEKTEAALGKKLSACASCGRAWYCSRECQKSHWKSHKGLCKNIVKNIGSQKNGSQEKAAD
jgi:hypothetical protein